MKPQFSPEETWIIRRVITDCAPDRLTNARQTAGWPARSAGIGNDETSSLPHDGLIHSWCSNSGTVRPTGRTKSWARRTGTNETVIVGARSAGPASCRPEPPAIHGSARSGNHELRRHIAMRQYLRHAARHEAAESRTQIENWGFDIFALAAKPVPAASHGQCLQSRERARTVLVPPSAGQPHQSMAPASAKDKAWSRYRPPVYFVKIPGDA